MPEVGRPCTAVSSSTARTKGSKIRSSIVVRDADALVAHADDGAVAVDVDPEANAAAGGRVLDGVAEQVDLDLLQPVGIAEDDDLLVGHARPRS